jgi:nicotinate-nucleotide--dimethylbenzimidazole phosphoribosyltransferase
MTKLSFDKVSLDVSSPANMLQELEPTLSQITAPDSIYTTQARAHLDTLTKPLGSLGYLEDIAAQLVTLRRGDVDTPLQKAVYVFAADHGITAEGVSAYPAEVTRQMILNFLAGGAAINVLAHLHRAKVTVVDVGVAGDLAGLPDLLHRKVRLGSRNMLHEPAMSWEELAQTMITGLVLAEQAAGDGLNLVAPGEMGIGNTTAASALTAAITGCPIEQATGHGTGLTEEAYEHKISVLRLVLKKHLPIADSDLRLRSIEILRRMGGLEIAAMTGFILGAAAHRIAVVADGFISTAAAAMAVSIAPSTRHYLFCGHQSEEPGHRLLLAHLGLRPILQLHMRLGEGTGAVLAMPILESALHIYREMATFQSAGVSEATP